MVDGSWLMVFRSRIWRDDGFGDWCGFVQARGSASLALQKKYLLCQSSEALQGVGCCSTSKRFHIFATNDSRPTTNDQ